jgi:hypothetical protein
VVTPIWSPPLPVTTPASEVVVAAAGRLAAWQEAEGSWRWCPAARAASFPIMIAAIVALAVEVYIAASRGCTTCAPPGATATRSPATSSRGRQMMETAASPRT